MKTVLFSLFAAFLLTACHPQAKWQLHNITGHMPDLHFSLMSDGGKNVTAANYHGKTILLYFGFTGCSSQCPLTLKRLENILQTKDGEILFVSIDPDHDTPAILHSYIAKFGTHIVGLTGSKKDIEFLAKRYRIALPVSDMQSDITHSNSVFIFDGSGHARLLLAPNDTDIALTHDLELLTP